MMATDDRDATDWDQDAESGKLLTEVGIGDGSMGQGAGAPAGAGKGAYAASPAQMAMCGIFSIEFYRPYFDVDTSEVKARLLQAVLPKQTGPPFLSDADGAPVMPDLYGPVWVSATLIFAMSVVSSTRKGAGPSELDEVSRSVYFILGYLCIGSLGLWGFFRTQNALLSGPEAVSVYGYSLTPFVVAAPLCLFSWPFRWFALAAASACAALFVLRSSWTRLQEVPPDKAGMTLLVAVSIYHVCWFILLALSG